MVIYIEPINAFFAEKKFLFQIKNLEAPPCLGFCRILSAAVAKQFPESLAAEDSRLAIPAGPSQALSTVLSMTSSSSSVDSRELPFDFFNLEAAAGSTAGVESPLIRRSSSFTQLRSGSDEV